MAYDEKTADRVRRILSGQADVAERKMMGDLCFLVKGGMCCSVSGKGGLLVRIDPEEQPRMLREPLVTSMEMGPRTMTRFVRVAPEGYRTEALLKKWVMLGVEAVGARKPSRRRDKGKGRRKRSKVEPKS